MINLKPACGGVIIDPEGRILLREPSGHFDGYVWTFSKGRPEHGETLEEAALREVREETGVFAEIVARIPGTFSGGTTENVYFLMRPTGRTEKPDTETASLKWATPNEARVLISETTNQIGRNRDLAALEATEIPNLLSHDEWRRAVGDKLKTTPGLGGFWSWFEQLGDQQRANIIAPLLNKLRAFLLRGPVRAIVGQAIPKLDIDSHINSGGLLLLRIPKGTIGEETSRLLGAFTVARVWQAAMRRAHVPEMDRPDTTLYVDEMHNYLALPRSFEDLLAEARGYRLSLVLAHQHMNQLPRDMREALAANARTKVVFACSPEDAAHLERHFEPLLMAHDLHNLGSFQAACRPCVDAGHGTPFTFTTEPLASPINERAALARKLSAERFGALRVDVEAEIGGRHSNPQRKLLPEKATRSEEPGVSQGVDKGVSRGVAEGVGS